MKESKGLIVLLFIFASVFAGVEVYMLTHFGPEITLPINGTIVFLWVVSKIRGKLRLDDAN